MDIASPFSPETVIRGELGWHSVPGYSGRKKGGFEAGLGGTSARGSNMAGERCERVVFVPQHTRCQIGRPFDLRDKHDGNKSCAVAASWRRRAGAGILERVASAEDGKRWQRRGERSVSCACIRMVLGVVRSRGLRPHA